MRVDLCLNPKRFTKTQVLAKLPLIQKAVEKRGVRLCYLMGSVLEDRMGPLSDVDIAILPNPSTYHWLHTYNEIYEDLCEVFRADNIDVIMLNEAPPPLRFATVRDGLLVYAGDEATRVDFVEEAIFHYHDTQPMREEHWHFLHQHIKLGLSKEFNMIDREKVRKFVSLMKDAVQELINLRLESMAFEEYFDNKTLRALSEHYLRIAIEAAIDLGRHVLAARSLRVPEEYKKVAQVLAENGVIPWEMANKLAAMAGLRNILVHLYWDIDYHQLYKIVTRELEDFDQFAQCIQEYVERES